MGPITQINCTVPILKGQYKNLSHICHPCSMDSLILSSCHILHSVMAQEGLLRAMWIHNIYLLTSLAIIHIRYDGKESTCNEGDLGLILGSGRFLGTGNGYPPPVFLENSMDRGAWHITVHGVTKELDDQHLHFLVHELNRLWNLRSLQA